MKKQMEKHTVFMDGNIQSYYFINSFHLGIQILTQSQIKSQQDLGGNLYADSKIYLEMQMTQSSQANFEKQEQN